MTSPDLRVVVLGAGAVGKTSMIENWLVGSNNRNDEYDPTVAEETYRKQVSVDDRVWQLDVVDTAGQAEWDAMRDQIRRACDGYVLVFDFTSRTSFDELATTVKDISELRSQLITKVPIVVVGNKAEAEDRRAVTALEGEEFASSIGAAFVECSAARRTNLDEVFNAAVRQIVAHQQPAPARDGNPTLATKLKRLFRK